jgi:peptidoglycan/LPS O-acetylase OafA/YrhL
VEFRRDIEGLRGIAVMLVVLSHLEIFGVTGGFIGVDVFFVISGFLITSIICHEYVSNQSSAAGKGTFSLAAFYSRRVRRIVPLSLFVLFCTTLTSYQIFNSVRGDRIQTDSIWAAFFVANIRFIRLATDYFQQGFAVSPVQHFWSLAVEEQFYIFFPGLFLLSTKWHGLKVFGFRLKWNHRVGLLIGAITGSSFMWSLAQTSANPTSSYFSSLTRAWEIGVGGLVAVAALGLKDRLSASMRTTLASIGLLFIIFAAFRFDATTPFPGVAALLPVGGAALIIIAGIGGTHVIADVLSFKVLTFIGRISFSVYLWHWPILVMMKSTHPTFAEGFFGKVTMLIFTIILSFFSFKFVEQPFRKMQFLSGRRQDKPVRKRQSKFKGYVPLAIPVAFLVLIFGVYVGMNRYYESKNEANLLVELTTDVADIELTPDSVPLIETDYKKLLAEWQTKIVEGTRLEKIPSAMSPSLGGLVKDLGTDCFVPGEGRLPGSGCLFGNIDAPNTAIILGDSHAKAIYPMVINALNLDQWRIISLAVNQCMIADVEPWADGVPFSECVENRDQLFDYVAKMKPQILVLADWSALEIALDGSQATNRDQLWENGFEVSIAKLSASAQSLIFFGIVPGGDSLQDCVSQNNRLSKVCFHDLTDFQPLREAQSRIVEESGNLFINPEEWLCQETCPPIIDNTPVFTDGSHIAPEFAKKLAPLFRAFLVSNNLL